MRLAPARSSGVSRVMSDRLVSRVTAARRRPARRGGHGKLEQLGIAVVHHPVLGPGQPRREPAAHRAAAAAEVVDHEAAGRGEVLREALGELGRARRRVGRLAQDQPLRADPDGLRAHRAAPARTPERTDVVAGHPRSDARRSRAARRRRPRSSASPSQARSAAPRAAGSPGATSSPGRVPSCAVPEGLGHPADVGGEDRQPAGQRLGDDHAVGLGVRGEHEQVRGGVGAVELRAGARSREAHPVAQPLRPGRAAHAVGERRVAVQAAHARAAPGQVRRRRERVEQHVVPLGGRHRRDAEQRVAGRGPRREAGGVDAGLGHVHAVGRQRVQLPQPAPGPCAGGDDGGGRREDLALARPEAPASSSGGGGRAACARARPAAAGARAAPAPRARRRRSARRAAPRRRPGSARGRARGRRRCAGRGQAPAIGCSCTAQPSAASPRQTWRS